MQRTEGRVHYMQTLCHQDVNNGTVKQVDVMDIHIIWMAEHNNVFPSLLIQAFVSNLPHSVDGGTPPSNEILSMYQAIFIDFQSVWGESIYTNLEKDKQEDFEIETYPNCKIPFHRSYSFLPCGKFELLRQIHLAFRSCCILPEQSWLGYPELLLANGENILHMFINYCAVNAITINNHDPLPHIEESQISIHVFY